jgi:1-deoxy-D-xylulose-5-phosphate reductoisomerase
MEAGESMPAVMNAANEVAVDAFLAGKIQFLGIPELIERTMNSHEAHDLASIEEVLGVDEWARARAWELLK